MKNTPVTKKQLEPYKLQPSFLANPNPNRKQRRAMERLNNNYHMSNNRKQNNKRNKGILSRLVIKQFFKNVLITHLKYATN